jgi:hypothetical protein
MRTTCNPLKYSGLPADIETTGALRETASKWLWFWTPTSSHFVTYISVAPMVQWYDSPLGIKCEKLGEAPGSNPGWSLFEHVCIKQAVWNNLNLGGAKHRRAHTNPSPARFTRFPWMTTPWLSGRSEVKGAGREPLLVYNWYPMSFRVTLGPGSRLRLNNEPAWDMYKYLNRTPCLFL